MSDERHKKGLSSVLDRGHEEVSLGWDVLQYVRRGGTGPTTGRGWYQSWNYSRGLVGVEVGQLRDIGSVVV